MRRGIASFIIVLALLLCGGLLASCNGLDALLEDKMIFASDGNGGAVLVSVQGYYGKDAVIPRNSPKGEPVVGIGSEAFAGSGVLSVTVPDGVAFIDGRAFASCAQLKSFFVPDTVKTLGLRVFEGCISLSTLTVGEGNTVYYSDGNCIIRREDAVLVAGCGASVIPDGVSLIASGAFYGASRLPAAVIPEGVTDIASYAFYGCSGVNELSLPQSLESIGEHAFDGCSSVTEITVSPRITALNQGAFRNCSSLVTVNLPEGLEEIGDMAFQGCVSLVDPVLPDSLRRIGGLAFSGCNAFIHLKLPKNLTFLGDGAFSYCDYLFGIKVDKENTVFRATDNCLIRREDGVIVLGTRGSKIPEDETVTAIGDRAFFGAKFLRNAVIPPNIRSIGKEAFYGCDYLERVIISDATVSVGDGAFAHCFTLHTACISASVEKMGCGVFVGCTSLKEILIASDSISEGWRADWNGSLAIPLFNSEFNEDTGLDRQEEQ